MEGEVVLAAAHLDFIAGVEAVVQHLVGEHILDLVLDQPLPRPGTEVGIVTDVGEGVERLSSLEDGTPVAVRSDKIIATAFHPELTDDTRVHELFLSLV